jgi:hypothetical protein
MDVLDFCLPWPLIWVTVVVAVLLPGISLDDMDSLAISPGANLGPE